MKTKEQLNALKEEVEAVNKKLAELNEDELTQITGGVTFEGMHPCEGIPRCHGRASEIEKCPWHGTSTCPKGY